MDLLKSRSSEIVLVLMLVLLFGCIRVYYGGEQAFMIVWKGELSLADTLVSLDDMIKMPRTQLQGHHRSVYYQLEEMGYLDDGHEQLLEHVRRKNRAKKQQQEGKGLNVGLRDGQGRSDLDATQERTPIDSTSAETKNDSQDSPGDASGTKD